MITLTLNGNSVLELPANPAKGWGVAALYGKPG
jgi:hypothetical protein